MAQKRRKAWSTTVIRGTGKSGRQAKTYHWTKNPFSYKKGIPWTWIIVVALFLAFAIGIAILVTGIVKERKKNGDQIYDFEKNSE